MLNGCRVDVGHQELAPGAVGCEASKKSVSIVFYGSHNYEIKRSWGLSMVASEKRFVDSVITTCSR